MMAKKLKRTVDTTARVARNSGQSDMVAKPVGGNPMEPAASPTTTQPMPKVVAKKMHITKKVAKVGKKASAHAKPLNKPAVRKKVK